MRFFAKKFSELVKFFLFVFQCTDLFLFEFYGIVDWILCLLSQNSSRLSMICRHATQVDCIKEKENSCNYVHWHIDLGDMEKRP
jgi:hypothetical protein